jgi:hypothetical protein
VISGVFRVTSGPPPLLGADDGGELAGWGGAINVKALASVEVPPAVLTTTSTTPAGEGGVETKISVELDETMLAVKPPKVTETRSLRVTPVRLKDSPPAVDPE